ncbi:MAG: prolyl oligopeptidase family serine peptidase [Microbacterium sp.]|uniref:alpha/beta hydrolase family protein n=1 Tax=Microbacterium sp. TaxID=51671 RepID=UPI0039E475A2
MKAPRRAAGLGASTPARAGILSALTAIIAGFGVIGLVWFAAALRVARLVITPAARRADTRILGLDTAAQTISLSRTPDTELPGRYGLFTRGSEDYIKLGSVLHEDAAAVTRKLLTHVDARAKLAVDAAFSGWYYDRPEQLHLPFTSHLVGSAVGPCPAWVFPADGDTWCIQVHGRGTTRAECLRAVPLLHSLGLTTMVVSYRNDADAPRSRSGTYGLGATEWRDVDAAVGFARRSGARRILLMGWSMGGAICLQLALNSAHRDRIVGIILDSPVVDWRIVLGYQAQQMRLPQPLTSLALRTLASDWGARLTGGGAPIPFDKLDAAARAAELRVPILLLHSDDDGFVPSDGSHALAAARPDLVRMETFTGARHTKLWNYDQNRWNDVITAWLADQDIVVR